MRLVYFRILHERYGKSTNGILRYNNRMFSIRLVYFKLLQKKCWKSTNGIFSMYSTHGVVLRCVMHLKKMFRPEFHKFFFYFCLKFLKKYIFCFICVHYHMYFKYMFYFTADADNNLVLIYPFLWSLSHLLLFAGYVHTADWLLTWSAHCQPSLGKFSRTLKKKFLAVIYTNIV